MRSMGLEGGTIDVAVLGDPVYSPPEIQEAGTPTNLVGTPGDLSGGGPKQTATPGDLDPESTPVPATNTGEEADGFSG